LSTLTKVEAVLDSFQSHQFIFANRGVMRKIGINPTLVLAELLAKQKFHASENQLQKDGSFYCTVEKLEERTTLSGKAQNSAIKILKKFDLVDVYYGQGKVRFFRLLLDKIESLIKECAMPVTKKEKAPAQAPEDLPEGSLPKGLEAAPAEVPETPEGTFRNAEGEALETPNGLTYKKEYYPLKIKKYKLIKKIKTLNTSSSKKKEEDLQHPARNLLVQFLNDKGFNKSLIDLTVKQFKERGLRSFGVQHLQKAFFAMQQYDKNVRSVEYPPIFFTNGVELQVAKSSFKPKSKPSVSEPDRKVPVLLNWLDNDLSAVSV
jgi:hypothetical protein